MKSEDPTVNEIREVFRLVNACCDKWDHPDEWQVVLLDGVIELLELGASVLQFVMPGTHEHLPQILPIASKGWKTKEAERLYLQSIDGDDRPPLVNIDKALGPAIAEGSVSFSRPMVVPDDVWYPSDFYRDYVEPIGLDEWVSSFRVSPTLGSVVMVGGNRAHGDEPIAGRKIKLLGILGEEITPLLGTKLSLRGQVSKAGLTPRQRQTLELLLDGLSEKQVAAELGLSPATVHDYIVKLHKHFDVSSRGELLSYFIKRRPKDGSDTRV